MNMNEIIIVGSRYGELASVVKPLYAMMTPVAQTEIKEKLGGDVVYLSPTDNQFDDDAVGVFTVSQQLLGYVWMYQSYGLKQMLRNSGKRYVKAQISRMNTTFGLLMATSDGSWTLDVNVQDNTIDAPTWAVDLPEVLTSMASQSLTLGLDLLSDELRESTAWSDRLRQRVDNVLRHLPLDLSASHCQECMEVYRQMKQSTIAEVRQHSELLLQTLVSRGSQQQMEWWTEHWLTDFFASAASSDLLRLYEADGWTLERVEELLRKAPERLFQLYLVNKYRFATHLYYSRLSQRAYDRLLTLLAVREAMLRIESSTGTSAGLTPPGRYGPSAGSPMMSRFLQTAKAATLRRSASRLKSSRFFLTTCPRFGARTLRQRPLPPISAISRLCIPTARQMAATTRF